MNNVFLMIQVRRCKFADSVGFDLPSRSAPVHI
jgi:hypothetical protein